MALSKSLKGVARQLIALARRLGLAARPTAIAQQVSDEGLTYLGTQKLIRIERALARIATNKVAGDYVELWA